MATISTADNALDSIQRMATELSGELRDPLALKGALAWGWHAVLLMAYHRLRPARESFDHWFWDYLAGGAQELEVDRDARWEERQRLSLLELLDILSAGDLDILKPEFYQGWQDRTVRCRTLRNRVAEVIGDSIGGEQREQLILLLATHNRLLRLPAAIELEGDGVPAALPALLDLLDMLVDRSHDHSQGLLDAIAECRAQL